MTPYDAGAAGQTMPTPRAGVSEVGIWPLERPATDHVFAGNWTQFWTGLRAVVWVIFGRGRPGA